MIITGSAEPKLIIGWTWTPPPPPFRLVGTEKLGCCYTFWFLWLTIWHHVNWNHSPSRSPSLRPCLEFWESESKCRLDRETGSSLLYACGCTSIDYQDLKWRRTEGNCRPISAALLLWGRRAPFFFGTGYILNSCQILAIENLQKNCIF